MSEINTQSKAEILDSVTSLVLEDLLLRRRSFFGSLGGWWWRLRSTGNLDGFRTAAHA